LSQQKIFRFGSIPTSTFHSLSCVQKHSISCLPPWTGISNFVLLLLLLAKGARVLQQDLLLYDHLIEVSYITSFKKS
jgi:hypothetical protein